MSRIVDACVRLTVICYSKRYSKPVLQCQASCGSALMCSSKIGSSLIGVSPSSFLTDPSSVLEVLTILDLLDNGCSPDKS